MSKIRDKSSLNFFLKYEGQNLLFFFLINAYFKIGLLLLMLYLLFFK